MIASITPEDMLAHPRFAAAKAAHIDATIALFKGDRFVTRMMVDAGAIVLRGFLVSLHFAFDPAKPETWATRGNVRRAVAARGLASPRRVDDMLARFRQADYVTALPSPSDGRSPLLVPTERLIAHDRDHLAAYHRFLLELFPGQGYEWVLTQDAAVHRAFRATALKHLPQALSALTHEAMRLFLARDAGYLALLLVAQRQLAGPSPPTWASMSTDLGVSRSHLRSIFADAEAAGYVRFREDPGRSPEILPLLWRAYDGFAAGVAAGQHAIAQSILNPGLRTHHRRSPQ